MPVTISQPREICAGKKKNMSLTIRAAMQGGGRGPDQTRPARGTKIIRKKTRDLGFRNPPQPVNIRSGIK